MAKKAKRGKKSKKFIVTLTPIRNTVALNPLLHKGGVHQKSNKALRQANKKALRTQVRKAFLLCLYLFTN